MKAVMYVKGWKKADETLFAQIAKQYEAYNEEFSGKK